MSEHKWNVVVEQDESEYDIVLIWPNGNKEYLSSHASLEEAENAGREFTNYLESINWRQ